MNARPILATALVAAITASACSTQSQGLGGGELAENGRPEEPVLFSWQSNDGGITGTMAATLPDATYTGSFLQITSQIQRTSMAPMWVGWSEGWGDWPYWSYAYPMDGDFTRFTRNYSGKVVANLQDARGQRMRCRFHLNTPAAGMGGGGQGECQLAGGRVVGAVINRT